MASGETLVVRQSGQNVSINRAKGDPIQLHSYTLDGVRYQKFDAWTEYEAADNSLSDLSYDLLLSVDRAYSADPSVTLTMFCPQTVKRVPSKISASDPTGGVGAYNPGSPGGKKPSTSNVDWSTDPERTFLRFTLIEFPNGVVTDLNTNDYNIWHVVGTPLNVVWSNGWSADECRSKVTWYNSQAVRYNSVGADPAQLMAGSSVAHGVYSYEATSGHNKRWVTTADEFQVESGITDQQKEQMFHCNSSSWSSGWRDGDYTSMWGTDAESVTPGNLYKVYKANDAFLYLLNRLSESDNGAGGDIAGWNKDEAMEKWSEYVHDANGNLRTKYRVIVETGGVFRDPDGVRRAYTLREMMAYSIYNSESQVKGNLIWDQASTMVNMARWMRLGKDNQYLEYPLNEDGTPTGEELHSTNGFRETDSYVDTIQYPRPIRDTIFSERRSFGLHIFSPFNFERTEPTTPSLEVTKKTSTGIPAGQEWSFTVTYTSSSPTNYTATKSVTETANGLKFTLKADETILIDFVADPSFRCEVTEDDSSKLTSITGTGGVADMTAKKFTTTSSIAKATFTNGTEPPPPPTPTDEPTPGKAILFKRDANTNKGVGPATFKFSSVVNGVYEFDTNASGELEAIQWWDPTETAGKYIKPGEYAVTEIIPPPNYEPTSEVQQIKLELDADGNPIPAGPLVFKNLAKVGLRLVKYDRQSHQPMNGVTFEIFCKGTSIGWYETKGQGEILLTGIEPGTSGPWRWTPAMKGTSWTPAIRRWSWSPAAYIISEIKAPDGYVMDNPSTNVVIGPNGDTQTVTVNPMDTQTLVFLNEPLCSLTIRKLDATNGKPVPNTEITLKDGNGTVLGRYTTGADGTVTVTGLIPNSTVVVVETRVPSNYVLDPTPKSIEIKGGIGGQTLTFINKSEGGLELIRVSEADKSQRIKGVTFEIRKMDGALVDTVTTGDRGRVHVPLDAGDYYCVEVEAAEGFKLPSLLHHPGRQDDHSDRDQRPL